MIHKVTMYAATCDNCGESFSDYHNGYSAMSSESGIWDLLDGNGWFEQEAPDGEPDRHYCDKCHTIDGNGVLVINAERHKAVPVSVKNK